MKVIYYDKNRNAYANKDIVAWTKRNGCDYVLELHRDSFNATSKGCSLLINSAFNADEKDKAVLNTLVAQGYYNRGFSKRSDLYNCNVMADAGLGYSLAEIGFISNDNDNAIFDKTLDNLGTSLYTALEKAGVKTLGVICGHGQGDPGAVKGNRKEADDVRRINIHAPNDNPIPNPNPNPNPQPKPIKYTNDEVATQTINGTFEWNDKVAVNGRAREDAMAKKGYDYSAVQVIINTKLGTNTGYKPVDDDIVKRTYRGDFGNDPQRSQKLKALGYDPKAVQAAVNKKYY